MLLWQRCQIHDWLFSVPRECSLIAWTAHHTFPSAAGQIAVQPLESADLVWRKFHSLELLASVWDGLQGKSQKSPKHSNQLMYMHGCNFFTFLRILELICHYYLPAIICSIHISFLMHLLTKNPKNVILQEVQYFEVIEVPYSL